MRTVGLFVTCLVDLFRPSVAQSAMSLLQQCGFHVVVSRDQTCCGRSAWQMGDVLSAKKMARDLIYDFYDCDYVVTPSALCAGMVARYQELFPHPKTLGLNYGHNFYYFDKDEDLPHRTDLFFSKFYEITDFLYHIVGFQPANFAPYLQDKKIIYHESCASLYRTNTHKAVRGLLGQVGVPVLLPQDSDNCCGASGGLPLDFPNIATALADKKLYNMTDADIIISADLDCLLHLKGRMERNPQGNTIPAFYHLVEFLDGGFAKNLPPIGQLPYQQPST